MAKERLEALKDKFCSLCTIEIQELLDNEGNISTLQNKLNTEKSNYNSYISKNSSLSSQLSQAQNDIDNKESVLRNIEYEYSFSNKYSLSDIERSLRITQNNLTSKQNNLTSKQNNLATLQKLNGQQALVSKIHGYLSDYQDNPTSIIGMVENDQLAAKLVGELAQLNLE
jgi:chromosome segregation ATPase